MSKKDKKKKVDHAPYKKKIFLAPESINSMAVIFTKIHKDGTAIIRISDCHKSIRLWNDLNNKEEVEEMLIKIVNMQQMLSEFREEIKIKLNR